MIKLAKKGLLSVALLATVVAKASKIVTVNSPGAKVVNITFSQVSQGEKFSIVNANGNILLEEVLNKAESYVKTINFSPLKEGIYFLETKKEKEIKVTPIFIKSNSVNIATGLTKTYSAPKISTDGNLIHLLVKNFDKSSVSVSISDKNGKEVVNETNHDLLTYRTYDFSKLKSGMYTVSVTQNDYNFTQEVKF